MQAAVTQRCESPIVTSHKPRESQKEDPEIVMHFGGMNVIRDNKSDSDSFSTASDGRNGSPTEGGGSTAGTRGTNKQDPSEQQQQQQQSAQTHSSSTTSSVNSSSGHQSLGKKKNKKKKKNGRKEIQSVSAELSHATRKLKSILTLKESNIVKVPPSDKAKKRIEYDIVNGQFEDAAEPDERNNGQNQYPTAGAGGLSSPPFGYFSLHPSTLSLHPPSATYHFYPSTPMPQMGMGNNNNYAIQNGYRQTPFGGGFQPNSNGMSPYQQRFPGTMNPQRQQQQQQQQQQSSQLSPGVAAGAMNPASAAIMQQKIQQQQLHLQQLKQQQAKMQATANAYPQARGNEAVAAMYGRNLSGGPVLPRSSSGDQERASNTNSNSNNVNHVNPFNRNSSNNNNNANPFSRSSAMSAMMALAAARDSKNDPAATRALLSRLQAQGQPPPEMTPHAQMQQQRTPQPLMDEMRAFSAAVQQQQQQNERIEQEQFQQRAQKQLKQKHKRERDLDAPAGAVSNRSAVDTPIAPAAAVHQDPSPSGPYYVDGEIRASLLDNDVMNMESLPMLPVTKPDKEKKNPVKEQDITHCDVLLGRGGMTNHHIGNMHFRTLVHKHKMHYVQAKKGDKGMLSKKLTNYVRHKSGRFLQKDDEDGLWYECGDQRAHAKFAQALREGTADIVRQMMEQEEGGGATKSNNKWDDRDGWSNLGWDNRNSGHVSPANFATENAAPRPPVPRPQAEAKQQSPPRVVAEESKPRKTPIKFTEDKPEKMEFEQAVLGMVGLDEERRKRMKVHHVESESESDESESEAEDAEYI